MTDYTYRKQYHLGETKMACDNIDCHCEGCTCEPCECSVDNPCGCEGEIKKKNRLNIY